jgi:hypothetical protein
MMSAFDVEDKKGYVKCSNGSVQLTGLDGRQTINVRANELEQTITVSYHGNDVDISVRDIMPMRRYEADVGTGPYSKTMLEGSLATPVLADPTGVGTNYCGGGGSGGPACTSPMTPNYSPSYKYKEDVILRDLKAYIDSTYDAHYNTDQNIQVLDGWLALGSFVTTCRDVAIKYLWRYGKKNGSDKKDLMKTLHYTVLAMFGDHYRD